MGVPEIVFSLGVLHNALERCIPRGLSHEPSMYTHSQCLESTCWRAARALLHPHELECTNVQRAEVTTVLIDKPFLRLFDAL